MSARRTSAVVARVAVLATAGIVAGATLGTNGARWDGVGRDGHGSSSVVAGARWDGVSPDGARWD
jgi:hypothetical protein